MLPRLGFIILRHVKDAFTNEYWLRCYRQIRAWYPREEVLVVDDGSDYGFVVPADTDAELARDTRLRFARSTGRHRRSGELLPYLLCLEQDWKVDRFVFLHDSVFLQTRVDFESVAANQPLWSFHQRTGGSAALHRRIGDLIALCDSSERLREIYRSKRWVGAFGGMSVFSRAFAESLQNTFALQRVSAHMRCRLDRMACERILGMCFLHFSDLDADATVPPPLPPPHPCSVFGNINRYCEWGYSYEQLLLEERARAHKRGRLLPAVKVWTGR